MVCIASGPSLTLEDCNTVGMAGLPVIVTNTTFRWCLWANALYAFDAKWWRIYQAEVDAAFHGRRFAGSPHAAKYGAEVTAGLPWFRQFRNSGACSISLAIAGGAGKIVLVGYDAGFIDGRKHWHGDHPTELANADSIADWPRQFEMVAKDAAQQGIKIINASRHTRLTCFPRAELEAVL